MGRLDPRSVLLLVCATLSVQTAAAHDSDADGFTDSGDASSDAPPVGCLVPLAKSLLVERSHGGGFDASGLLDYLSDCDWTIDTRTSGEITHAAWAPYDIVMIQPGSFSAGLEPFTADEIAAVSVYLAQGGGLWVFHEYSAPPQWIRDPAGINSLTAAFGVEFQIDSVADPTDTVPYTSWPIIHELLPHPVTESVLSYQYRAGCCVATSSPSLAVAAGDDDASSAHCPTFPPTLAVWEDGGRAVFSGDITPLHPGPGNFGSLPADDRQLLFNIVTWLVQEGPVSLAPTSWGRVKSAYRR